MNEVYSYLCFDVCGFAAIIHWIPLFIPWRGDDDREEEPSVLSAVSVVKKECLTQRSQRIRRERKEFLSSPSRHPPIYSGDPEKKVFHHEAHEGLEVFCMEKFLS